MKCFFCEKEKAVIRVKNKTGYEFDACLEHGAVALSKGYDLIMDNPKKLYSLTECLLWMKIYFENVQPVDTRYNLSRVNKYIEHGSKELKRLRQLPIITCAIGVLAGLVIGYFIF